MYHPDVGDTIGIDNSNWRVLEHPAVPGSGIPYGQEGRAGIVYQLGDDTGNYRALKVFKPHYRQPSLVRLARKLEAYAGLPGLAVCRRTVLTPQQHGELLRQQPDLLYAALMPWIPGKTWHETIQYDGGLSPAQSLALAQAFLSVMVQLEQEEVAHGDLSASNVLIDNLESNTPRVELVDVEQLYAPGMVKPAALPSSSPGYAHRTAGDGIWEVAMDRFSGAVLLAEMLGSCDERIRAAAAGETYFAEDELQQDGERYQLMRATLAEQWGEALAVLFEQAWRSDTVAQCPPFGSWQIALPLEVATTEDLATWLAMAREAVGREDWTEALEAYRKAQRLVEPGSSLSGELPLIVTGLQTKISEGKVAVPVVEPVVSEPSPAKTGSRRQASAWMWLLIPLAAVVVGGLIFLAAQRLEGSGFLEPTSGQSFTIGEAIMFSFNPVRGADEYEFDFRQLGRQVWHYKGPNRTYVFLTSTIDDRVLEPGPLEVTVRSIENGQRSEPTTITVTLLEAP